MSPWPFDSLLVHSLQIRRIQEVCDKISIGKCGIKGAQAWDFLKQVFFHHSKIFCEEVQYGYFSTNTFLFDPKYSKFLVKKRVHAYAQHTHTHFFWQS